MDTIQLLKPALQSIAIGLIVWLIKLYIDYKFKKHIEITKSELNKNSETELKQIQAKLDYEYEARKRLYSEIGPLKFQLLLACRDISRRISHHAIGVQYNISTSSYYGASLLYRLLKPIALLEIVVTKLNIADFRLDDDSLELLKLRIALYNSLSCGEVVLKHPNADWSKQADHIYFNNISTIANKIIVCDESKNKSICSFNEFEKMISDTSDEDTMAIIKQIFTNFSATTHQVFWIRLVCVGYICNCYTQKYAKTINANIEEYDIKKLLLATKDSYIIEKLAEYQTAISSVASANTL